MTERPRASRLELAAAVLLGVGNLVFLGAVTWVATFPVSFAV